MIKNKSLSISILKCILLQDDYITTSQLANALGVSNKTITNYMTSVFDLAKSKNINLISKRGHGYIIINDSYEKKSIAETLTLPENTPYFKKERLLFLIHTLLTTSEPLRIPYLEYILHLSRPSVYKCLDEVNLWFEELNIILHKKNYRGIYIECGEKRFRRAVIKWYKETLNFLDSQNKDFLDTLKLKNCLAYYDNSFADTDIEVLLNKISELLNINYIDEYYNHLKVTLKITFFRVEGNNFITLPTTRKTFLLEIDNNNTLSTIIKLTKDIIGLNLSTDEAMYLYNIVLSSPCIRGINIPSSEVSNMELPLDLLKELYKFIKDNFNCSADSTEDFIVNIKKLLEKEILCQIGYHSRTKNINSQLQSKYPNIYSKSSSLYNIITKYLTIYDSELVTHSIFYNLLNLLLINKNKLKAILIHNCLDSEYAFLINRLNIYFYDIEIIYSSDSLNPNLDLSEIDYDLILTTTNLSFETNKKVLRLNIPLAHSDITYLNTIIHNDFEEANEKLLIK